MTRTILITGATGNQGGAIIKALQGTDYEILAVSRNTSSPSAQKLATSTPNIKLIQGDLDNCSALFETARKATKNPIWGVYSVQAKPTSDISIEETQGKSLIDAAIDNQVEFFVYSSVDRGGEKSKDTPTTVPHWATKHRVEKYLEQKAPAAGMRFTVLRPTCFMENLTNDFAGKAMAGSWSAVLKDRPLQLVATKDIGWFGAEAFKRPDDFAGRYLSLAGAELTFSEANTIFKKKFGKDLPATYGCVAKGLLLVVKDLGAMFQYLKHNPVGADVEELRKLHPGLMNLGTWFEKESQFRQT
ncbi:NAD(P)-binding protein [Massarina eburnea CBS 473.64]|uniref:NAD(P)-binding protein n=1 Tax=Massarina eburnea CBS 473.64 TaxID=1395130 RepID=A0A6A6RQE6_9PLEO|nr:NAD(P)-binding protein [Massarina eburnea CBS 473.64]